MRYSKTYTITIGTYSNAEELRGALKDGGCDTGGVDDLLSQVVVSPERKELNVVVVTVEDLGLAERVDRKEIYDRAQALNLDLCPAEVAPQLWLQHKDRIDEPQLYIGMEPLTEKIFQVGRYGPSVFFNYWSANDVFYSLQSWAFIDQTRRKDG
jgi:hypothetical protein